MDVGGANMTFGFPVENLPSNITSVALKDIFIQIGDVQTVTLKMDSQSSLRGFVEMFLDLDVYRAVNCFDKAIIKDRKIRLTEYRAKIACSSMN
jgi:RNA recognition motif-containing protein